jgi:hypothetical protein
MAATGKQLHSRSEPLSAECSIFMSVGDIAVEHQQVIIAHTNNIKVLVPLSSCLPFIIKLCPNIYFFLLFIC